MRKSFLQNHFDIIYDYRIDVQGWCRNEQHLLLLTGCYIDVSHWGENVFFTSLLQVICLPGVLFLGVPGRDKDGREARLPYLLRFLIASSLPSSSLSMKSSSMYPYAPPTHCHTRKSSPYCSSILARTLLLPSTTCSTLFHSSARRLGECSCASTKSRNWEGARYGYGVRTLSI